MIQGESYDLKVDGIRGSVRWMYENYEIYFDPYNAAKHSRILEQALLDVMKKPFRYSFYTIGMATLVMEPTDRVAFELLMVER